MGPLPLHREQMLRAVSLYLDTAYPEGMPLHVRTMKEQLEAPGDPLKAKCVAVEELADTGAHRYLIRLGNAAYPHMKLTLDPVPTSPSSSLTLPAAPATLHAGGSVSAAPAPPVITEVQRFLFGVDTHDRHCCPEQGADEYDVFCALMERNRRYADAIEAAWEQHGIPTFKSFLRADLVRRQSAGARS